MEDDTMAFMEKCGLGVSRPNKRIYTGKIGALKGLEVIFQRSVDIPGELDAGVIDAAILGYERFLENRDEKGDSFAVVQDLGFSRSNLVVAVPNSWHEVRSSKDLAKVAKAKRGERLRVGTKYHRLVGNYLRQKGVAPCDLVHINGAIEAAPLIGTADVISDMVSSGATLRENNLRPLDDGTIVESAACFVVNKGLLKGDPKKLALTKTLLELIEARLRAEGFYSIIANIRGESVEAVAAKVTKNPIVAGMQGPTVSTVVSKTGERGWYSVSVVVPIAQLADGVDHLRKIGASGVVVFPAHYVFGGRCEAYETLVKALGAKRGS
jgi:ATP phosphoribosyltransferase